MRRISWVLVSLAVLLVLGGVYISIRSSAAGEGGAGAILLTTLLGLTVLGFLALGLLVAHRRPRNPVGWIIAGSALLALVSSFTQSYAVYALFTNPGSWPGGEIMAWFSNWAFIPVIFCAPSMLFLLFPNGHFLSRRWIAVFWVVILTACATVVSTSLQPVMDDPPFKGVANPVDVVVPDVLLRTLSFIGWPGMAASFLVAALAMILRLRRSQGVERQQLKWMAAAAAVIPLASAASVVSYYLGIKALAVIVGPISILPIFLAAGYAVLRYRLYDIDLVINRTLVYGSLTVSLALIYVGCVATLQYLFGLLSGGGSQLVIVASTLAIAALFNPLRRRIQGVVDRVFYRQTYDAAKTLEAFSAKLREETDLDELNGDLVSVVRQTMQPEHVTLWLRSHESEVRR